MDNLEKALTQYSDFVNILKTYGVTSTTCETDMKSNCLRISAKLRDSDVQESGHTAQYVYEQLVRHSNLLNDNFKIKSGIIYNNVFNVVHIAIGW